MVGIILNEDNLIKGNLTKTFFEIPEYPGKKFPWFKRPPEYLWRLLRQFVYERDGGKCSYCEKLVELFECHVHHVLELNQGGTNHPSNLKVSCRDCHKDKHPFMKDARDKMHE
jgi:5-methylcytosine-specific restriction endonuclease McrA